MRTALRKYLEPWLVSRFTVNWAYCGCQRTKQERVANQMTFEVLGGGCPMQWTLSSPGLTGSSCNLHTPGHTVFLGFQRNKFQIFLYSVHSSNFFHASFPDIWPSNAGFSQISILNLCKALVWVFSLSIHMCWVSPTQPLQSDTFPQSSQWVDFFPYFSRLPHYSYLHISLDVPDCSKLHVWRHLSLSLTSLQIHLYSCQITTLTLPSTVVLNSFGGQMTLS